MKIAWIQVLLSLILGFAVGFVFDKNLLPCCFTKQGCPCKWNKCHKGEDFKKHMLEKFSKELDLNEEQKVKVASIFEVKHTKFKAIKESTHEEINKLLTPEQQAKFEQFKAKREKRHKKCG